MMLTTTQVHSCAYCGEDVNSIHLGIDIYGDVYQEPESDALPVYSKHTGEIYHSDCATELGIDVVVSDDDIPEFYSMEDEDDKYGSVSIATANAEMWGRKLLHFLD